MTYTEKVRNYCEITKRHLHERVDKTEHHVWFVLYPGYRIDCWDKDFEHCMRKVWAEIVKVGADKWK